MKRSLSIEFKHLETFCRVAELRSFSKAGEDLFLTQPTISGHILSLEKTLSLQLFDRSGRDVRLTKAGKIFHQYASKMLRLRQDLINGLFEFSQGLRGELSIGASTIPGEYILPKLLGDFKREHPHLTIDLKIADTKEVAQWVLEDLVEFGLIGAKLDRPSLRYETFTEDEIIPVGLSTHPISRKKRIPLEEIMKEGWIIREEGSGTQMAVDKILRKGGRNFKQFHVVAKMGSTSSVKEGVKAGLGFAFLSKRSVEEELNQGLFSRIYIEGIEPIFRQIYIVSRKVSTLSPMGLEFLKFLKKTEYR
ncbi:MAG: selenium metabolism-associated LysR family transcriptional regulator [Thermodesulfobacteriota bacterium]